MSANINTHVLMSGADFFDDAAAINPFMDDSVIVSREKAAEEHMRIKAALQSAGIKVEKVSPPDNCQDGVYTANWGLVRNGIVILSSLPNVRQPETPYAAEVLSAMGYKVVHPPKDIRFSGQGDALPCGDLLFCGSNYRTDPEIYPFITETLGYQIIALQTVPDLDIHGRPVINKASGWPDSFFYDIDLALSVLRKDLIAWCPDAFTTESQEKIRSLDIGRIEVSLEEAKNGFACNLVSTGEIVVMSAHAPLLQAAIELHGLATITPEVSELGKGGGYIRCTSLTLDNS